MESVADSGYVGRQQGFFRDAEAGTEAHDSIVAWLASPTGRAAVSQRLNWATLAMHKMAGRSEHQMLAVRDDSENPISELQESGEAYDVGYRVHDLKSRASLEIIFRSQNGFIVGFADAVIETLKTYEVDSSSPGCEGYRGVLLPKRRRILIEVKTGELKLGETLRQINAYAAHDGAFTDKLLVLKRRPRPDYLQAVESQGISVALFDGRGLEWLSVAYSVI